MNIVFVNNTPDTWQVNVFPATIPPRSILRQDVAYQPDTMILFGLVSDPSLPYGSFQLTDVAGRNELVLYVSRQEGEDYPLIHEHNF